MLSVVIPTLNAAPTIGRTLEALAGAAPGADIVDEVVVVDGGSGDNTEAVVRASGARLVAAPAGRGGQLAAGAAAAKGDWLLFLHADTVLAPGWQDEAAQFIATGDRGRAAAFRFALDDPRTVARFWEGVVAWRCRLLGLAYGDQGLLISHAFYDRLGGFRPLPLMEDVELVRRIGRRRLALLETGAVTSAERYRRDGYVTRTARNGLCLGLYLIGVPPRAIARLYG